MDCLVVFSEHSFEFVNISIVLFLLKSDIDYSFRNIVVHFFELLGFLDQNLKIFFEIDFISIFVSFDQNLLFQEFHSPIHNIGGPLCIFQLLIVVYFFDKSQILILDFLIMFFLEFVLVFVELDNRTFHPLD